MYRYQFLKISSIPSQMDFQGNFHDTWFHPTLGMWNLLLIPLHEMRLHCSYTELKNWEAAATNGSMSHMKSHILTRLLGEYLIRTRGIYSLWEVFLKKCPETISSAIGIALQGSYFPSAHIDRTLLDSKQDVHRSVWLSWLSPHSTT